MSGKDRRTEPLVTGIGPNSGLGFCVSGGIGFERLARELAEAAVRVGGTVRGGPAPCRGGVAPGGGGLDGQHERLLAERTARVSAEILVEQAARARGVVIAAERDHGVEHLRPLGGGRGGEIGRARRRRSS